MATTKKAGLMHDFKEFIMRGNVVDLAIAVIIGGAFGQIVNSLIADIITPAILQPVLTAAKLDDLSQLSLGGIKYGVFLAAVLNFLVIAFVIFLLIRMLEKAKRLAARDQARQEITEPPAPDPAIVAQEQLTAAVERLANIMENQNS